MAKTLNYLPLHCRPPQLTYTAFIDRGRTDFSAKLAHGIREVFAGGFAVKNPKGTRINERDLIIGMRQKPDESAKVFEIKKAL